MRQENDRKFESFTFCASGYETIPEADFMGYRTLHTKNGFHKPILNAYKLLNRLGPELVGINNFLLNDHVSAFATRDANRITIVVTNYQHDKISNDGNTYQVNLDINTHWISNANLTIRHWRIDENHSNSYTVFKKEGAPKLPNPLQVDAIKKRMELEMLEPPGIVTNKELSNIVFQLPCNSVSLIEIIKN